MLLPETRGPLTAAIVDALRADDPEALPTTADIGGCADPLSDDERQLALWICYELYYRGFDEVDDAWEWHPALIALRAALEGQLLDALRHAVAVPADDAPVAQRLRRLVDADDGPSLSRFLQTKANRAQFLEFVIHRSIYQLKEADPHSWALPRLAGRAKAALVEIQTDEYGNGRLHRMHSELFRQLLREVELRDEYGAFVDDVPAVTLAISNVMSMFGLRRELRGALVGHLAAYEMTSSAPCRRYAKGLRRLGGSDPACAFYDEHVTADALHEQIIVHDLCGGLSDAEPQLTEDIMFGAAVNLYVETRFAEHVLRCWGERRSSLRSPVGELKELADVS